MTAHNYSRRDFLKTVGVCTATLSLSDCVGPDQLAGGKNKKHTNILLITADDMNYNSPGIYGCEIPNITPNIDRLAAQGVRFTHAHVNIAVCQPSRQSIMTGRYPHRNGAEGFEPIDTSIPTLQEQLRKAGYLNAVLGKEKHLMPKEKFCWDFYITEKQLASGAGIGRDPQLYYQYTREFLNKARTEQKPFFLMANSHDPHRPFAGSDQEKKNWGHDLPKFRRRIKPQDVNVPAFLPDIPGVRQEIAEYYTSVHRCDETVGAVLKALQESGLNENTIVMFISDNGMSFPFAKANCYLNSTKTPWIVRWPGKVKPQTVDHNHFISGIDYMPTILDALGLPNVPDLDGVSFLPLLRGESQPYRTAVYTQFHETSAPRRFPMRCVQNRRFGYIFNFWSDNKTILKMESKNGRTWKAMVEAAKTDPGIDQRVIMFQHRVPEEFYDFQNDPDGLVNLIDHPKYQPEIEALRKLLRHWMIRTQDPALEAFTNRNDPARIQKFMQAQRQKTKIIK
ncbi:sulfatase [Planctomycetota bacterium]